MTNTIIRWNMFMINDMNVQLSNYVNLIIYIMTALLGLVVGSFLNVVIYRVPNNMSVAFPPSHCPKCDYKLKWYDNIPVISYLILGGKCRACKESISFRYTLVELGNAILWVMCTFFFLNFNNATALDGGAYSLVYAVATMIACSCFLCVAFIDLEHTFIPDRFQIIIGVMGLLCLAANFLGFKDGFTWQDRVIGAVGSAALFTIVYFVGMAIYKREAMGIGDIKLVAVAGLLIGWKNMILAILIAAVVGAVVLSVLRRARNDEKQHEYPFGPFLVLGILVAMFAGQPIINAYLSLM